MLRCSIVLSCAVLTAGCASKRTTTPGGVPIDTRYTSASQDSRALFLVLHYAVANLPLSIKLLTEPPHKVSANCLVSDATLPVICQLLPEDKRAWHSGPSRWRGHQILNDAGSIGIEIVHLGFVLPPDGARHYLPFPPTQFGELLPLVKDIVQRHGIRPKRVVGHSEVLPQTTEDPGRMFSWRRLADDGLIAWPVAQRVAGQTDGLRCRTARRGLVPADARAARLRAADERRAR